VLGICFYDVDSLPTYSGGAAQVLSSFHHSYKLDIYKRLAFGHFATAYLCDT
jgi:hypothetical protein